MKKKNADLNEVFNARCEAATGRGKRNSLTAAVRPRNFIFFLGLRYTFSERRGGKKKIPIGLHARDFLRSAMCAQRGEARRREVR